ncbi:MAG TPA: SGNH/GDSL hydrolase family protein [Candidatus Aquicultor sp.]|jgi:hypothetical protein
MSTYLGILEKYQNNERVIAGFVGNSVGCGYYANNWDYLVEKLNMQLTTASRIDTRVQSMAIQLRAMLKAKNAQSDLYNLSGDGWCTEDHLGRGTHGVIEGIPTITALAAMNPKPDIVFIALNINDLNHRIGLGAGHINWTMYCANTRTMVQQCLDNGMVPVLVKEGNVTMGTADGKSYADYIAEYDVVADEFAVQGIGLLDTYTSTLTASGIMYDSLHRNQAGHYLGFADYEEWFNQPLALGFTAPTVTKVGETLQFDCDIANFISLTDTMVFQYKVGAGAWLPMATAQLVSGRTYRSSVPYAVAVDDVSFKARATRGATSYESKVAVYPVGTVGNVIVPSIVGLAPNITFGGAGEANVHALTFSSNITHGETGYASAHSLPFSGTVSVGASARLSAYSTAFEIPEALYQGGLYSIKPSVAAAGQEIDAAETAMKRAEAAEIPIGISLNRAALPGVIGAPGGMIRAIPGSMDTSRAALDDSAPKQSQPKSTGLRRANPRKLN